jgi:hypothetical protein
MKKRNHLRSYIQKVISDANSAKLKRNIDMFRYCVYNSDISEKFYKFLDLCLKMPFEIQTEDDTFILTINLSDYDVNNNQNNQNNQNTKYINSNYNDNFVIFYITKNNFKVTKNHTEVCGYKDPYIYNLFQNKFEDFYNKKSDELFHKIINEILDVIPAIGREYKIDEILKD